MHKWTEAEMPIGNIESLLYDNIVEVTSPDGWVEVTEFVDKGLHPEYVIIFNNKIIRCKSDHLFKNAVTNQWITAEQLVTEIKRGHVFIASEYGAKLIIDAYVTNDKIPIVDITVNHTNHRYYTDGVESHNTGGGKTLFMCHMAAANLLRGYNVLYITLEMSEKSISERIDANLLDIDLDELINVSRETYIKKIDRVKSKTTGRLKIKEYPTAGASAANFRHLLNELRLKQNFVPDIIYVDYLNICCSSRIKLGNTVNSYTFVKTIAEELRGLAQEFNVPLVTATQVNRTGFKSSDPDLADTSESFGLPATSDFFIVLTSTDELNELNQIMVKQLKNRYTDVTKKRKFVIGINRARMKLFDVSEEEQTLNDDAPIMDKTSFGQQDSERSKKTKKFTEFT